MVCTHDEPWLWGQLNARGEMLEQRWCAHCGALHDGDTWHLPSSRDGNTLEILGTLYTRDTIMKGMAAYLLIGVFVGTLMGCVATFLARS